MYSTGSSSSVSTVDVTNPPTITEASGRSALIPWGSAAGRSLNAATKAVITTFMD
jgi:hypothetical protein